jgi:hypothetical protein
VSVAPLRDFLQGSRRFCGGKRSGRTMKQGPGHEVDGVEAMTHRKGEITRAVAANQSFGQLKLYLRSRHEITPIPTLIHRWAAISTQILPSWAVLS